MIVRASAPTSSPDMVDTAVQAATPALHAAISRHSLKAPDIYFFKNGYKN